MRVSTYLLPRDLPTDSVTNASVVVFDVLRATTSITAALDSGVAEVRVYGELSYARAAAASVPGHLLCGEENCLPPPGFDLGNSPAQFTADHAGRTALLSTTNGTRAILAARKAPLILAGALTNAKAVEAILHREGRNVILLCAGSNGQPAMEDLAGAGAVIDAMAARAGVELANDISAIASRLFAASRGDLGALLRQSRGGQNILAVGLDKDIEFAANLNSTQTVGAVRKSPSDEASATLRKV